MASRALGEGIILRVLKRFAFINDNKLGKIYFPIDANLSTSCTDLRDRFNEGDRVLFSAQKQSPPKNECNFTACTVVKPDELVTVEGTIVTVSDKFAYAKTEKLGRVFMPFSARTKNNEGWAGNGAEENVRVQLDVMPQTPINDCQYVAYHVTVLGVDSTARAYSELLDLGTGREPTLECPLSTQSHSKLERQPDRVDGQIGIVVASNDREAYVYAPLTGMCYLSARSSGTKKMEAYYSTGTWAFYDVLKKPSTMANIRCSWIGTNIRPYDPPINVHSSYERHIKTLTVNGYGVVCRVNQANRCSWLWNDYIGRIYVNSSEYQRVNDFAPMQPFDIVKFSAIFKGTFEDVPWTAYDVVEAGTKPIEDCAKMLVTDDNWKVLYIKPQPNGAFFGFLDHEIYGSAFFAWTDLTGDQAQLPAPNTLCRVSAYKQFRDTKHRWRAVLVTPCDAKGRPLYPHPKLAMATAKAPAKSPVKAPMSSSALRSADHAPVESVLLPIGQRPPPPPGLNNTNLGKLNLDTSFSQQYNQQNHYARIAALDNTEGLERELELVTWGDELDQLPTNGSHYTLFDEKKTPSSRSSVVGASASRNRTPPGFEFSPTNLVRAECDIYYHLLRRNLTGLYIMLEFETIK
uniref:Uncharacterized protein n=1 Tax=Plectus sambesii TaxID=2011161 RepID=A0A914XEA2_9BILA